MDDEGKILFGDHCIFASLLTSICNNGGFTKQIHKPTRNKMVVVSIVFYCVLEK